MIELQKAGKEPIGKVGRPPALEPKDLLLLQDTLRAHDIQQRSKSKRETKQLIATVAKQRRVARGQPTLGWTMNYKTEGKYIEEISEKRARPQAKTEKRLLSESDICNFVSLAAVLTAIMGEDNTIKNYNMYNTDVTTEVIATNGATFEGVCCAPGSKAEAREDGHAITRATIQADKFLRVRCNMTTSAVGQLINLVNSRKGFCKEGVKEPVGIYLPGLNNTGDPSTGGWFYLIPAAYKERDWMKLVSTYHILPAILEQREKSQQQLEKTLDLPAVNNMSEDDEDDEDYIYSESECESDDEDDEHIEDIEEDIKAILQHVAEDARSSESPNDAMAEEDQIDEIARERLDRILWSFDGDIPQIQTMLEEEMAAYIKKHRVELLKFAASCSGNSSRMMS